MGTFIEVQPRNFIYFSLERPGMGLILDGIHNKSKIKEVSGEINTLEITALKQLKIL